MQIKMDEKLRERYGKKVLIVDTSGSKSRVAIYERLRKVYKEIDNGKSHSHNIMENIEEVLKEKNIGIDEIDKAVVVVGPGSFTGIRIGMAVVKGIMFGTKNTCMEITSLELIAREYIRKNIFEIDKIVNEKNIDKLNIYSVIDAKNDQIYFGKYILEFKGKGMFFEIVKEESGNYIEIFEKEIDENEYNIIVFEEGQSENILPKIEQRLEKKQNVTLKNIEVKLEGAIFKIQDYENGIDEIVYKNPEEILPNYIKKTAAQKMLEEKQNNMENKDNKNK